LLENNPKHITVICGCIGWAYSEIERCLNPTCPLFHTGSGKHPLDTR
jgi:hypothetical protein